MSLMIVHPCVRLRPPGAFHSTRWVAEHLWRRTRIAMAPEAAAILVATFNAVEATVEALESLASKLKISVSLVTACMNRLCDLEMIIAEADPEGSRLAEFFSKWARYQWFASADYYISTYDYGFADYEEGGRKIDRDRMSEYAKSGFDTNRVKSYENRLDVQYAGLPDAARIVHPLIDILTHQVPRRELTRNTLFDLLAMTFGKVTEMKLASPGAAAVICRTSPSGGSRHPTEGYVVVHSIKDLRAGWYHYCSGTGELELIRAVSSETELAQTFYGACARAPFTPRAVIFMTSVFARNMYRYREPRTFRSIHMDVGHLVGSLLLFAQALGIRAFAHSALDEESVERAIDTEALVEGAMFSIAIGDNASSP